MKPKVPGNAFTIFIKSLDQGELKLKDFMYDAAIKWNMLPEEEKDVFRTLAKKYEKQYCHEISQWEKNSVPGVVFQDRRQIKGQDVC
ncbi:uncharacterized protein [Cherax quadricarinatus]|uniref:uncharacterized protein n=1 Tax=Cherax quadricarinatus TaxID=27406 RepID=UPI00387E8667